MLVLFLDRISIISLLDLVLSDFCGSNQVPNYDKKTKVYFKYQIQLQYNNNNKIPYQNVKL